MQDELIVTFYSESYVRKLLGIKSWITVEYWLHNGQFPRSIKIGDNWWFEKTAVVEARKKLDGIRERNRNKDLEPSDSEEEPPLL